MARPRNPLPFLLVDGGASCSQCGRADVELAEYVIEDRDEEDGPPMVSACTMLCASCVECVRSLSTSISGVMGVPR